MEAKRKKQLWIIGGIVGFILIVIIINASNISKIKKEKDAEIASLQEVIGEKEELLADKDSEIAELTEKVASAKPWFELAEKEKERKIQEEKNEKDKAEKEAERIAAEKKAEEDKQKLAAEKKAKEIAEKESKEEAEAKKKAEAEERKGYDTGITFDQIARNPDDYEGEKVKFTGKVIQVMEGDGETQIRIAVNDNYDTVVYGAFDSSIVKSRILEDDMVTVRGLSTGLLTYESSMGGNITIPSILIFEID